MSTTGNYSAGINVGAAGSAYVDNTALAKTTGYGSNAIAVAAGTGKATVISDMAVTYGDHADAISASSVSGGVAVTSAMAYTKGDHSNAIYALSQDSGAITITSTQAVTKGDYSDAIYAYAAEAGTVVIHSDTAMTFGDHSDAIKAVGDGGVKIYADQTVTEGAYSNAIVAVNTGGDILVQTTGFTGAYGMGSDAIFAENFTSGNVTIKPGTDVFSAYGIGIHVNNEGGHSTIYNAHSIYGGAGAIVTYSKTGSYIDNTGVLRGGHGYAIGASGGGAVIENQGAIYGYVHLSGGGTERVVNDGAWFVYGDSTFGATSQVDNDAGHAILIAPFSSSAVTVNWTGLEVFNNAGLVDLRNGHTGDVLNMAGAAFNGTGNSTLALDVSLSANLSADELIVGAVSGSTRLILNDISASALPGVNIAGVTLIHGASGTASNFTWAGERKGFVLYELEFNPTLVDWNLVGLPDQAGVQMLVRAARPVRTSGVTARTAGPTTSSSIRDAIWSANGNGRGEGWSMWANAQAGGDKEGGVQSFNLGGSNVSPLVTPALGHAQCGAELEQRHERVARHAHR